jgi:hypothetical protein
VAFQQGEDNLAALRVLETEAQQRNDATDSARQSLDLFTTRYEGGVDTYLQVITWQTAALQNERNDIDITRRRLEASVLLIKALGGCWGALLSCLSYRDRLNATHYSGRNERFNRYCFVVCSVCFFLWIACNCLSAYREQSGVRQFQRLPIA